MTETPFRPVLHTQADVEQMWRRLMTPLGFTGSSLWTVVVEDDRPLPRVMEVAELPMAPEAGEAEALAGVLERLADEGTRFAFLRSRPGGGRPDESDRAWARTLYDAGRRAGARLEVVHLAHDHDIYPLALDDLLDATA
ncbi:MAG TPA: hypothetical protein VHR35_13895 [Nocardioides sp.]|jgi:hypothetical protein|nr:hypothetical protein [Nocardioides sp.]